MSTTNIKEAVREKYGEAALRVRSGGSSCCGASLRGCGDPITSNLYDANQDWPDSGRSDHSLAGLRQSDGTGRAESGRRLCSISGRAAASMCCCRLAASARPAKPTAST